MSKPGWKSAAVAALVVAMPLAATAATLRPDSTGSASRPVRISEAQAMKDIQLDGYTNVQDLRAQKKGWTANAMEGGKQVSLLVNDLGVRKQ